MSRKFGNFYANLLFFFDFYQFIYLYMKPSNKQKNQEVCVTLVLSPVCNASSKADTVE